jgi:hypothetical protein
MNHKQKKADHILCRFYEANRAIFEWTEAGNRIKSDCPPGKQDYLVFPQYTNLEMSKTQFNAHDFFLQEGLLAGWFASPTFLNALPYYQSGLLTFAISNPRTGDFLYSSKEGRYTLMRWEKNSENYTHHFEKTDYFSFLDYLKAIPEFKEEKVAEELRLVPAMGGMFLHIQEQAFACIQMMGNQFVYVSFLGIIPAKRKSQLSSQLMEGLCAIANDLDKDIVVAVRERKIVPVYQKHDFKIVGYWKEIND